MRPSGREFRVGAVLLAALAVLVVGLFLIGRDDRLWGRKSRYFVRFDNVGGLSVGGPVQLNGVDVGRVEDVVLPKDMGEKKIDVWVAIDRRYSGRIRQDSAAKIKTLGLLGDRYVAIQSGSPDFPEIPERGEIPTGQETSVEQLIASGEDVVQNVVAISHSLSSILQRVDRGEGLLGELTTNSQGNEQMKSSLRGTLDSVQKLSQAIENGQGPLGRMINDREMGDRFANAVARLEGTVTRMESGSGLVPSLLNDAATKQRFDAALENLAGAAQTLKGVADDIQQGNGLLPRLLHDKQYGQQVSDELQQTIHKLNGLSDKLQNGNGTLPRLLNDPQIYDAINDIVVGVHESKMLSWLIRNRQKAGIQKRYQEQQKNSGAPGEGAANPPPSNPPPPPAPA